MLHNPPKFEEPNVVVPGGFVGIEHAETLRQGVISEQFKKRCPELYQRAVDALVAVKRAQQELALARAAVVADANAHQTGDIMDAAERDALLALKQPPKAAHDNSSTLRTPHGVDGTKTQKRKASSRREGGGPSLLIETNELVPSKN